MMAHPNVEARLGSPIPYGNPHAISVSLPTWIDNVGWASGASEVVDAMQAGYPRFFIARNIAKLAQICLDKLHIEGKLCMLFPNARAAKEGVDFLRRHAKGISAGDVQMIGISLDDANDGSKYLGLHLLIFPTASWKVAKAFWQHAGMGISTRYAEACLSLIPHNQHLRQMKVDVNETPQFSLAQEVKRRLRERVAFLALHGRQGPQSDKASVNPNVLAEGDVYLYPSGMFAIWHAHQMTMSLWPEIKPVCFGFLYTDTLKVLEKWGSCHFYGLHPDSNLAALEALLAKEVERCPAASPPISALFCECPSNPLLQSPDLVQLRKLADHYGFIIIMDETIGTFVNVNVLPYVDIIVTSLSKLFSGKADVMGGSLVLNPKSRHYGMLKSHLQGTYHDDYWPADAIVMELNSRDFASRVDIINGNTRAVCHFLRSRALSTSPDSRFAIKDVFYPEWMTRANYDQCRRPGKDDNFGPLFSLTFVTAAASVAFYDALGCAKGPSLGTNFTLSCPYTLLAHYHELDWAASYGVDEGIVRVSVGMENRTALLELFKRAVEAAEATLSGSRS